MKDVDMFAKRVILLGAMVILLVCVVRWFQPHYDHSKDNRHVEATATQRTDAEIVRDCPILMIVPGSGGISLSTLAQQADLLGVGHQMEVAIGTGPLIFRITATDGWSSAWVIVRGTSNTKATIRVCLGDGMGKKEEKTVPVKLGQNGRRDIEIMVYPGMKKRLIVN